MAKVESMFADSVNSIGSRKRKGVPLPYLIRPRREFLAFDAYGFYNDYLENSPDLDDEVNLPTETVDKNGCFGGNCFGLGGDESSASLSEIGQSGGYESSGDSVSDENFEEYVIVHSVKPEIVCAIQMLDLSKDVPDSPAASEEVSQMNTGNESESEDEGTNSSQKDTGGESEGEGSNSDGWEIV